MPFQFRRYASAFHAISFDAIDTLFMLIFTPCHFRFDYYATHDIIAHYYADISWLIFADYCRFIFAIDSADISLRFSLSDMTAKRACFDERSALFSLP
jgi:hypothetical protein